MAPQLSLRDITTFEKEILASIRDVDEQKNKTIIEEKKLEQCTDKLENLLKNKNPSSDEIIVMEQETINIDKQIYIMTMQIEILKQKKENIIKQIEITINKINELKINTNNIKIINTVEQFVLNLQKYLKLWL